MTNETNSPGTSEWGPLAPWGDRVAAVLIDSLVLGVVYVVGWIIGNIASSRGFVSGFAYLVPALSVYFLFMTGASGASPGKRVLGLKVVKAADGQVIGGGMGIVRGLAHVVDAPCFIGYLWPLFDPKRQTFADKIIGTVVLSRQPKETWGIEVFKV